MPELTSDRVKAEIQRFWNVFTTKNADQLAEFYAHESSVFGSSAIRAEPGRLAAARRKREYFHPLCQLKAHVTAINIVMLGDRAAVADYSLDWRASGVATGLSTKGEEEIKTARVTQVFALDHDGKVLIFHEHISAPFKF